MIVSNRNLKDVILFEECINQSTDDSYVNMQTKDEIISRKLSTPVFGGNISRTTSLSPAVYHDRSSISRTNSAIMNTSDVINKSRKHFKRAASLPNFAKGKI